MLDAPHNNNENDPAKKNDSLNSSQDPVKTTINDGDRIIDNTLPLSYTTENNKEDNSFQYDLEEIKRIPRPLRTILDKYEKEGWVSQEAWGSKLNYDEIAMHIPISGPPPVFKFENGSFRCINYPSGYPDPIQGVEGFEALLKKQEDMGFFEGVEAKIAPEIKTLLDKYEKRGWISQEALGTQLRLDEIAVHLPVSGPPPVFKFENGSFRCINYTGSYPDPIKGVEGFEAFLKKQEDMGFLERVSEEDQEKPTNTEEERRSRREDRQWRRRGRREFRQERRQEGEEARQELREWMKEANQDEREERKEKRAANWKKVKDFFGQ